jgi:sugar phosphate isomerase/epimerase
MNRSHRNKTTRRSFLKTAAAAAPAVILPTAAFGDKVNPLVGPPLLPSDSLRQEPLFRISLAQWSLHRTLNAGELDALDFAQSARNDYGIEGVEYVNSFFKEYARDDAYLSELKKRAADHGVKSLLIMVDGEGALGAVDDNRRTRAVENHYRWVEAARFLGCHSIRVNASSEGSPEEQRKLVSDGLSRLVEFADPYEINVIVENHGGLSSNGAWLVSVMQAVDHPRCGTLPDFGNFQIRRDLWYDKYLGVAELMPYAKAVSAKSHVFDREGNEREIDYLRMMHIVLDAGYHGYVGIEFEGSEVSEPEGIRLTKNLLEQVREMLGEEAH